MVVLEGPGHANFEVVSQFLSSVLEHALAEVPVCVRVYASECELCMCECEFVRVYVRVCVCVDVHYCVLTL